MTGRLVILSGPSGVGKDTVLDAWHAHNPRVQRVVAATTRAPREGEVDGVDYIFLSREAFLSKVDRDEFLEHMEVHDNLYGTPVEGLQALLAEGKIAVLKIDVQGALDVMPKRPDAITIFLLPPSEEVLEARLRSRSTDSEVVIEKRLVNAHAEVAVGLSHYQHHVINEHVPETVDKLEAIISG